MLLLAKKNILVQYILLYTFFSFSQTIKPKCIEGNCRNKIGTYLYEDSSIYSGEFTDRMRNGNGTLRYRDGRTYVGNWINDKENGKGVYTDMIGSVYDGDWLDGIRTGQCILKYSNGNKYVGEVKNNLKDGNGTFYYKDGSIYNGYWEMNQKTIGTSINIDGTEYEGGWLNDLYNGKGKLTDLDKNIYEGDFVNGVYNGYGKMQYSEGSEYSGQWKSGIPEGEGTYTTINGKQYSGNFQLINGENHESYFGITKNGKSEGYGIYIWPSGSKYTGEWINGAMDGYGIYLWADGERYEGYFEKGEFSGNGVVYTANGEIKQSGLFLNGKFAENGVAIGPQKWMFYNLRVSTFRNGDKIFEAESNEEWQKANNDGIPAYCCPGKSNAFNYCNKIEFGYLYNYFAVKDPRGLAPKGWHIPNYDKVKSLTYTVGTNATYKLKSKEAWGIVYHGDENGSDEYGFCAVPSGYRQSYGYKDNDRNDAYYWTSEVDSEGPLAYFITSNPGFLKNITENVQFDYGELGEGMAIRCVRDGSLLVSKPISEISQNNDGSYSEKKIVQVCSNQKYDVNYFESNKFFFESTKIKLNGDIVDDLFNGEGLMQAEFSLTSTPSEINKSGVGVVEKVYNGYYLFSHQQNKSQAIEGRVKMYFNEKTNEIIAVVFGVKGRCSYQVLFK